MRQKAARAHQTAPAPPPSASVPEALSAAPSALPRPVGAAAPGVCRSVNVRRAERGVSVPKKPEAEAAVSRSPEGAGDDPPPSPGPTPDLL